MKAERQPRVRPYFAGVVIEGAPDGGTLAQARELVAERLARHVIAAAQTQPRPRTEAAD